MPKIEIIEKDYTTPGLADYANFSVVVPGFCASTADKSVFDDNGVYEVSSQAEFFKKIGAVSAGTASRVFAKPELINYDETHTDPIDNYRKELTGKEFYSTYADEVYTLTKLQDAPASDIGRLIVQIEKTNASGEIVGYDYYSLTKVSDSAYDSGTLYAVVKASNVGQDKSEVVHYGNQIAYELLGLGYTVLYKDLTNSAITDDFLSPLSDKANYDFRFIISGYIDPTDGVNEAIIRLANKRGDCTALVDVKESAYVGIEVDPTTAIKNEVNRFCNASKFNEELKFASFIAPSLCYNINYPFKAGTSTDERIYSDTKFPGSFHYLACLAHSVRDLNFAEWYAVAGYTRGISSLKVKHTSVKLGENAISALEPRYNAKIDGLYSAVNVIANFRNSYLLWGNRTAYPLGLEDTDDENLVASHFMNIRQLCTTLKKELYRACRRFTFDPNSSILWVNFCNAIRPTLEAMKADQGIEDYEIIRVNVSEKATLRARVRIVPIEAVEDFYIELSLEDSLGDTNITVTE